MSKKNILVFPCGSEIGLEIYNSLKGSIHFNLIGGSSIADHGKFLFENYIETIPFIDDPDFKVKIKQIIVEYKIDLIYPAMDKVIVILKELEEFIGVPVIGSPLSTTKICLSKSKTYEVLKDTIDVPFVYKEVGQVSSFPVFLKPDIGYGSRGVHVIKNQEELIGLSSTQKDFIVCEYLPGDEFTVDCFTNKVGELLFVGGRKRKRIVNGISVNTETDLQLTNEFYRIAQKINDKIVFYGAWFFQLKRRDDETPVLLEIAARLAGSSSVHRIKGVNFAQMSVFQELNFEVDLIENNFNVILDRSLSSKFKLSFDYNRVYIDFDDTILIDKKINLEAISFIYNCLNNDIKLILITKHKGDLFQVLEKYKLNGLFDEVIHLKSTDQKYLFIQPEKSIFIDDSFSERKEVFKNKNIPVFSIDALNSLF